MDLSVFCRKTNSEATRDFQVPLLSFFPISKQMPMGLFPLAARRADLPWDDIKSTDGVTCWQHKNKINEEEKNRCSLLAATSIVNGPSMQDSYSSAQDRNTSTLTGRHRNGGKEPFWGMTVMCVYPPVWSTWCLRGGLLSLE